MDDFPFDFDKEIKNKAGLPRYSFLAKMINRPAVRAFRKMLPKKLEGKLKDNLLQSPAMAGIVLKEGDREYLLALYENDIRKTAELTGLDLSGWLKGQA